MVVYSPRLAAGANEQSDYLT